MWRLWTNDSKSSRIVIRSLSQKWWVEIKWSIKCFGLENVFGNGWRFVKSSVVNNKIDLKPIWTQIKQQRVDITKWTAQSSMQIFVSWTLDSKLKKEIQRLKRQIRIQRGKT